MIRFNTKYSGFTLIETLVALAIMATVLTPIFIAQGSMVYHVSRLTRYVQRMIYADLFLQESAITALKETKDVHLEKQMPFPQTQMVFDAKKVSDDSPLKKYPDLYVQRVTLTWHEDKIKRTDALVTFLYKPEKPKQEKKPSTPPATKQVPK
ncbi:MAG: type II secretion system protein J [Candidatus Babeliales bacterium]